MKNAKFLVAVVLAGFFAASGIAKDKPEGKGHSKKHSETKELKVSESKESSAKNKDKDSSLKVKGTFTSEEKDAVKVYMKSFESGSKKGKQLPPGLQKKVARGGELPPGWQKKLARGEVMPVEVYKVAMPLPKELMVKFPSPPLGTITVTIDGKIVRVMEKTREILDILELP